MHCLQHAIENELPCNAGQSGDELLVCRFYFCITFERFPLESGLRIGPRVTCITYVSSAMCAHRIGEKPWEGTRKYRYLRHPRSQKLLLRLRVCKSVHDSGQGVDLDTTLFPQVTINEEIPGQQSGLPLFLLALIPPKASPANSYDTHLAQYDPKNRGFFFLAVIAKKVSLKQRPCDYRKYERSSIIAKVLYISSFRAISFIARPGLPSQKMQRTNHGCPPEYQLESTKRDRRRKP